MAQCLDKRLFENSSDNSNLLQEADSAKPDQIKEEKTTESKENQIQPNQLDNQIEINQTITITATTTTTTTTNNSSETSAVTTDATQNLLLNFLKEKLSAESNLNEQIAKYVPVKSNANSTDNSSLIPNSNVDTIETDSENNISLKDMTEKKMNSARKVQKKKLTKSEMKPRLRFCYHLIVQLLAKKYREFAWPFYDPVDVEKLQLFDYHQIITEPMDMRTIKDKLERGEYTEAKEFENDFRLMLNNCYKYNAAGEDVVKMGRKLEDAFGKLYEGLPQTDQEDCKPEKIEPKQDQRYPRRHSSSCNAASMTQSQVMTGNSVNHIAEGLVKGGMTTISSPSSGIPNSSNLITSGKSIDNAINIASNVTNSAVTSNSNGEGLINANSVLGISTSTSNSSNRRSINQISSVHKQSRATVKNVVASDSPNSMLNHNVDSLTCGGMLRYFLTLQKQVKNIQQTVDGLVTALNKAVNDHVPSSSGVTDGHLIKVFLNQEGIGMGMGLGNVKGNTRNKGNKDLTTQSQKRRNSKSTNLESISKRKHLLDNSIVDNNSICLVKSETIDEQVNITSMDDGQIDKDGIPNIMSNYNGCPSLVGAPSPPTTNSSNKSTNININSILNKNNRNIRKGEQSKSKDDKKENQQTAAERNTLRRMLDQTYVEDSRQMTYDEKRELSVNINNLSCERLGNVVEIINEREHTHKNWKQEEIEIDFEKLQPSTLRYLEAFVKLAVREADETASQMVDSDKSVKSPRNRKNILVYPSQNEPQPNIPHQPSNNPSDYSFKKVMTGGIARKNMQRTPEMSTKEEEKSGKEEGQKKKSGNLSDSSSEDEDMDSTPPSPNSNMKTISSNNEKNVETSSSTSSTSFNFNDQPCENEFEMRQQELEKNKIKHRSFDDPLNLFGGAKDSV
ncbi:hypothetical protein SNEBB_009737 [Seison nebaliae]|nr:hypothetical protein SNEBB_009737 [Seison nebaliae]